MPRKKSIPKRNPNPLLVELAVAHSRMSTASDRLKNKAKRTSRSALSGLRRKVSRAKKSARRAKVRMTDKILYDWMGRPVTVSFE